MHTDHFSALQLYCIPETKDMISWHGWQCQTLRVGLFSDKNKRHPLRLDAGDSTENIYVMKKGLVHIGWRVK